MSKPEAVNAARKTEVVSARVPLVTRKRLEVIQAQRGEVFLSDTVAAAIEEFIVRHERRAA